MEIPAHKFSDANVMKIAAARSHHFLITPLTLSLQQAHMTLSIVYLVIGNCDTQSGIQKCKSRNEVEEVGDGEVIGP